MGRLSFWPWALGIQTLRSLRMRKGWAGPLSSPAPSSPWPPSLPWAAGLGRSSLCLDGGLPDLEPTCSTFHFPL